MDVNLLEAALDYADLGYRVFPLLPGEKTPATTRGCLDATSDPDLIEEAWGNAAYNIGIATDGLLVVDIDGMSNPWLSTLGADRLYDFAGCPTCRTPRGGRHIYFKQPAGEWRNTTSVIAPNVDTRADGGYVVAPPSFLESGGGYVWLKEHELTNDLREPPAWLVDRLTKPRRDRGTVKTVDISSGGNPIPSGQRNAALTSLAGAMRRYGMTEAEIVAALHVINCSRCIPPMAEDEVEKIAKSVSRYEPDQFATAGVEHEWDGMSPVQRAKPLPSHLLKPPGTISEIIDYNLATAHRRQPILALAGALALMSVITGRKVRDDADTRTNLYILGVAGSGTGKEHARKVNKNLLYSAGADCLVGPESPASSTGLISAIKHQPAILLQWDEMGRLLATLQGKYAGPHLANVLTSLMKLFTSSDSIYYSDAYADPTKNAKINQPHAVLYGTTVPKNLYENLSEDSISDGFLGRLLIFETETPHPDYQQPARADMANIVDTIKEWVNEGGGNLSSLNPEPRTLPTTPEAAVVWEDFRAECLRLERVAEKNAPLWTRAVEKARKLALLHACSRRSEAVDLEAANWGREMATALTERLAMVAGDWIADNRGQAVRNLIVRWLKEQPGYTATLRELARTNKSITPREMDEAVKQLTEREGIAHTFTETAGGRPALKIRLLGHADGTFVTEPLAESAPIA